MRHPQVKSFDIAGKPLLTANERSGTLTIGTQIFTVTQAGPNPQPTLSQIAPNSALAGSAGLTLNVTGSDFVNGSIVRWNGSDRATTFVSSTQLTAAIPASDCPIELVASILRGHR